MLGDARWAQGGGEGMEEEKTIKAGDMYDLS